MRKRSLRRAIQPCELPASSFLLNAHERGGFTDCYVTEMDGSISQSAFIEAFYTTPLFKVERAILKWIAAKPSTDSEAKQLAMGATETFAAWQVERRSADQLLLADFTGRTRSWLMVSPADSPGGASRTQLYFGSGVGSRSENRGSKDSMGVVFRALLGFHKLYSRLLLGAARSRLTANQRASATMD